MCVHLLALNERTAMSSASFFKAYFCVANSLFVQRVAPAFVCLNGSKVDLERACDGTDNCADGSDETKGCTFVVWDVSSPVLLFPPGERRLYLCFR